MRNACAGVAGLLCLLFIAPCMGAVLVDGRLDEAEWTDAIVFADFKVTDPLTRATPEYETAVKVLALPDALYVAMRALHPRSERTRGLSPRDARPGGSDPALLFLDFEGQGRTAYEFIVGLSGSQRDAIVLNQNTESRDWDGDWDSAVSEDDLGWTVEWRIPWSIAPEGKADGDQRTIGVYLGRYIMKTGQMYSFPATEYFGATFVQDFHQFQVPRYRASSFDWYPYTSLSHDLLKSTTVGRAGLDIVWRPNARNRIAASVNPDFSQVESDNLIVNFSAVETFFEEKRPFFTEGQQLFDLRLPPRDRLVNTRRIGAAPDAGLEGITEILVAGKYTGTAGPHEYGAFAVAEDDSPNAEGRSYLVSRYSYKAGDAGLGYLGTYANRPTLRRKASVHAFDYDYRISSGINLRGQTLFSDIAQQPAAANYNATMDKHGTGSWLELRYQPGGRWESTTRLTYMGRSLDFNDLGYQERTAIQSLTFETRYFIREYLKSNWAQTSNWYFEVIPARNASGKELPTYIELGHYWVWRNGSNTYLYWYTNTTGIDDLISRGNGDVKVPQRNNSGIIHDSTRSGRFRWSAALGFREQGLAGTTKRVEFNPLWYARENLSVNLELIWHDSADWLLWREGIQFATFRRQEWDTALGFNWAPRQNQEFRIKAQWVGLTAKLKQTFLLREDAQLAQTQLPIKDFSTSSSGIQVRYRYEFKPQAEIHLVYSRGGESTIDDTGDGFRTTFTNSWNSPTVEQVLMKLRYRFH